MVHNKLTMTIDEAKAMYPEAVALCSSGVVGPGFLRSRAENLLVNETSLSMSHTPNIMHLMFVANERFRLLADEYMGLSKIDNALRGFWNHRPAE